MTRVLIYVHHPEYALWNLPEGLAEAWQEEFAECGTSVRFWDRAARLFRENIERFLDGRPLLNLVDKSRGY